jgi:Fe2+ transport system protein FeoA
VEIFCKQFAIVRIARKNSPLNLQQPLHIGEPEAPDGKLTEHSGILYFGALRASRKPLAAKSRPENIRHLTMISDFCILKLKMQLSGNYENTETTQGSLGDLRRGDAAILDGIDLPHEDARRLMELGFLPGMRITAGYSAPGGDPQVFQVDGSEIALRKETARHLKVRHLKAPKSSRTQRS